ncbi:hypothetical protein E3T54_10910 [Cryobacterium sp. Sr8]|uniref:Loki-CTERM sorting domain-containing protein n=1 Tax=Cryobacterium sp. Sr8 TaxID=1259203 RepID=UPI00106D7E46|nr:Loki-CTERM sorting domain-containing protein [Cryobacterium sp. Sr8]TFD76083.1 hypothetical protein E3T54_10910 [Cryobacterium sp. Sr8]
MPTDLTFILFLGVFAVLAALFLAWKKRSGRRKAAAAVAARKSKNRTGPVWMTEYGTHPLDLD